MDQNRRNILVRCLTTVFGKGHDTLIAEVLPLLELLELNGGQTLVNKDDPADAVYFVVSGRLRTHVKNEIFTFTIKIRQNSNLPLRGEPL